YADSVILWTRITPTQGFNGLLDVSWEASRSPGFEAGSIVDSGTFTTSAARDWTVKVEADGLLADTNYYYRFRAGTQLSPVGETKTLPVGDDPVRLAVFSCANFTAAEQFSAYGRAAALDAVNPYDAWLHLGDYIYEYGPGGYGSAEDAAANRGFLPNREIISLDDYRQRYAQYHTDLNLQALRAAAPLIAIWDDHETANDSWAGGAENHQSATEGDWIARRDAALKAYHEWLPIREPDQRKATDAANALSPLTQGYRSFTFGDVLALHVLESRLTARDEQLKYPDAAAVQTRIGAILADPAQVAAYAAKAGTAPPTSQSAIPAFANALAPLVTQELVIATVQQAWGDPSRDLLGQAQLAWLQQQMATSPATWQVLGQQVLMQSMAVPAELLLNAGNPALLDKYAAPLQKLASGTPFTSLTASEQALFAEAGKIPYNLDAWDGYGVERETILQTALTLGKTLISLAGDTHNAWAGVLDTMTAGSKPVGTIAGVEFATPGVTSPGFEKYLPGADAYIRAKYPAVDGLDGLFTGYVTGLNYADLNRRGFLDLTLTKQTATASFQLLNAPSGSWTQETVQATPTDLQPVRSLQLDGPLSQNGALFNPGGRINLDARGFGLGNASLVLDARANNSALQGLPTNLNLQLGTTSGVSVSHPAGPLTVDLGFNGVLDLSSQPDTIANLGRGGNVIAAGIGRDLFTVNANRSASTGAVDVVRDFQVGLDQLVVNTGSGQVVFDRNAEVDDLRGNPLLAGVTLQLTPDLR
ncbi:MAG: hypothetical protein EBZ51_11105, partial [Synechococcaceae bacterium WB9_2_112]|nr:hypothetical protein [Synechococcaceae bacterium WB9_2_112]